jgi:prevent-host-death family protein
MARVGSFEARRHLATLLERVAKGEKIVITKRGKPVAMLVPAPKAENVVRQAVKEMLAYRDRRRRRLGGISFRDLLEEGRRY